MKTIKLLFILISLGLTGLLDAQTSLGKLSDKFDLNDTLSPFYTTVTYRLACNYAVKKQIDSCLLFLNLFLDHTGRKAGIAAILSSPELDANLKDDRWITLRNSLVKELNILYNGQLNTSLFLQILKYEQEDQDVRWGMRASNKKGTSPSGFIDTLNLKHLKFIDSLLSHHVELSKITVGDEGMTGVFCLYNTARMPAGNKNIRHYLNTG